LGRQRPVADNLQAAAPAAATPVKMIASGSGTGMGVTINDEVTDADPPAARDTFQLSAPV